MAAASLQPKKLAAVLERLGSPFDGERAAAGLLASRMVRAAGLSWSDVIAAPRVAGPCPPPAAGWRDLVNRCRQRMGSLTAWEARFITQLATQERISDRQREVLIRIAAQLARESADAR